MVGLPSQRLINRFMHPLLDPIQYFVVSYLCNSEGGNLINVGYALDMPICHSGESARIPIDTEIFGNNFTGFEVAHIFLWARLTGQCTCVLDRRPPQQHQREALAPMTESDSDECAPITKHPLRLAIQVPGERHHVLCQKEKGHVASWPISRG
ncbi:hypothetical protein BC827DRAFT_653954 [Russula dissimulans]|nr:hypothetical protein BC827DRAFT_653954 [Russula dissimulans]